MASNPQEFAESGVLFNPTDSYGRVYNRFYARQDSTTGPGWYVFGRNPEYGDSLIRLCARPDVKARRYRYHNGPARRGWATKRQAKAVADSLNAMAGLQP